jgi:nitrogen fixation protein FixH
MTRRFTGRHMLAIMLAFFGVVVSVNLLMATLASRTFGGTVVDNSYVASQRFNGWLAEAKAQERLGWTAALSLDRERRIDVAVRGAEAALAGAELSAVARHPLGRAPDVALDFREASPGSYKSRTPLPPGRWVVHLEIVQAGRAKRLIESLS